MTTDDYRITVEATAEGSHWAHMRPVGDALAEGIASMAAILRAVRGEATPDDFERLEVEPDDFDPDDGFHDWFNGWALDMASAHWDDNDRSLCRVEIVHGTGGPHTETLFQCDRHGRVESITYAQYWSGERRASTDDPRARDIAGDFLSYLLGE